MSRKDDLFNVLRESPTDKTALDNLVAYHARRGEFEDLYQRLQELVESMEDRAQLKEFTQRLADIVRRHLDNTTDAVLAANLKLRLAGLLFGKGGEPRDALILVTEAFEQIPTGETAQKALNMLRDMKLTGFVVQLLKQKAATEKEERRADTLLQLGHAALSIGEVFEAKSAFAELAKFPDQWSSKGAEGLKQVEQAQAQLEEEISALENRVSKANDVEKPVIKFKLGQQYVAGGRFDEGIALLEEVHDAAPSEESLMELLAAYKSSSRWDDLLRLVEQQAELTKNKELRKELLKERVRTYTDRLADEKSGFKALNDLYGRFPGEPDVVEFCANTYSAQGQHEMLAQLLGKARKDTRNRDHERRYLEWEAAVRWKSLGQLEDAEKLYRRIKSIDPRNVPALVFYEDYCREKGDFRKLYSTLSTRQSLAQDSQKVGILKSMAQLARAELASPDRAIDSLKKVLALSPADEEAYQELASLLEETARWHAVIELYGSRAERLPDEKSEEKLELLRRTLNIYSSKDKLPVPEMVVTVYRKILAIEPENGEAIDALADYYRSNRRWGELTEVLEKKAESETTRKKKIELHKEIAEILIEYQHQEGAAIPHLEKVTELDARDEQALGLLARAYRGRGEFEQFFELGRKQLEVVRGKEKKELLAEMATIALERLQLEEEGVDLLEQLMAVDPRNESGFKRLRQLYARQERFDDLAKLLSQGVEAAGTANQRRELKQSLAKVLAENLDRFAEAKAIYFELLEENPNNRQARQALQKMLAQAGEFAELEGIYVKDNNIPGLVRFLDEFRTREKDAERSKAAGLEMVRLAEESLKDRKRALQLLESLLEQHPADTDIARALLDRYPKKKADMDVAKALAVMADNSEGDEGRQAAAQLADVLEKCDEFEASFTRTLGLFLSVVRDGELALLGSLVQRAEKADSLDNLTSVLGELMAEDLPSDVRVELALQVADVYKSRMKNLSGAQEILVAQLELEPDSMELLRELEKIYTAGSKWEELEGTVRRIADLILDVGEKKEELYKLARLHEEITLEMDKGAEVYREIRSLDPDDEEAYAGLKRVLEELEDWEELAHVLEDELQIADEESARLNLLQLADLHDGKMSDPTTAAGYWQQVTERWPDDEDAWGQLTRLFEEDEALGIVLPLLESRYEAAEEWEALVSVLTKRSQLAEDELEKFELLGRCADVLMKKLDAAEEAFSCLTHMATLNPSDPALLKDLEETGRQAGQTAELFDLYKGLLGIGDSDFAPSQPLDEGLELGCALNLAGLAKELDDPAVAVDAYRRALVHSQSDLAIIHHLEELLEAQKRWDELLELLEEKRDLVWEDDDKRALYIRVADLLTERLDREEDSISWVESLHSVDETNEEVNGRLERLYLSYERWTELSSLLRSKLARLDGEERRSVAFQLATVLRDNLGDLHGAYELLSELIAQDAEQAEYLEALSRMLRMTDADDYEAVVMKAASLLGQVAEEKENWPLLCEVLEVTASQSPEPLDAANAWHRLGNIYKDKLEDAEQAFEAFARGVAQAPVSIELLQSMLSMAEELGRTQQAISAIESGVGEIGEAQDVAPLVALASALRKHTDEHQKAAEAYERLAELEPEQLDHYWALDELYSQMGRAEDRIRVLGECAQRLDGKKQADIYLTMAELQMSLELKDEALESLGYALASPDLLDEDRRMLAFHVQTEMLEADENWFELVQTLLNQTQFVPDIQEKKALLFRIAAIEEEHLENPDSAITHYTSIVDMDPTEQGACQALYRLLDAGSRFDELEKLLSTQSELTEDGEERMELLLRLARVRLFELGKADLAVDALHALTEDDIYSEEVVELLEGVVENFPDSSFRASQLLERAYEKNESWEKLAEIYKVQIDQHADEVDSVERYRDLATLYEKQFSDVDTAFAYISQAFKLEPTSEVIHEQLVSYAREKGAFDELFDIYLDVLMQVDEVDVRNNLRQKMVAIYHDELKDLEHAETIYRDMLDDDPGSAFALERLQKLYRQMENWEQLIEVLRMGIDAADKEKVRVSTLYDMAAIYREHVGSLADAMDTYEEILSLNAREWNAYRGIEAVLHERGDIQAVVTCLRRELDAREEPEEKKEVRLRMATMLSTELEDYIQAVDVIADVLAEFPEEAAALELLSEIVDGWDHPTDKPIDMLVEAYTGGENWDGLVHLYQKLASKASSDEDRMTWLRKIYDVRTQRQKDETGAFAASKVMATLAPGDGEIRELLVRHAVGLGEVNDLVGFLARTAGDDAVAGTDAEAEIRFTMADVLEQHADKPDYAARAFEAAAEKGTVQLAQAARQHLRSLYPQLEEWENYVSLLELLAGESAEPDLRKELMLEAGKVAAESLEDGEKAFEILAALASEFPGDAECLDPYEKILVELRKLEELEGLLRERVDLCIDPALRAGVRLRLGNLLLTVGERSDEAVEELLVALEENKELPALWNILESLMSSEETADEDRIRISTTLLAAYPKDAAAEKKLRALEAHLALEDDETECNNLHLALAGLHEKEEDAERAFFHYSQSLKLYPGTTKVEKKLHKLAVGAGLFEDYRDLLVEVVDLAQEESLQTRYLLEAALLEKDHLDAPERAAQLYAKVLELDSYSKEAMGQLELFYRDQADYVALAEILEREVAIEEDAATRLEKTIALARLFTSELEDPENARHWWEDLLHEQQGRAEAFENLQTIYTHLEAWETLADLLLERYDEIDDADGRRLIAVKLAGLYEQRLDNREEAFHWYKRLLEVNAEDMAALHGAKRCALALEDWETVASVDETLLATAEGDDLKGLQTEVASLYFERLGRKEDGIHHLQGLLQSPPVSAEIKALALSQVSDPDVGFQISLTLEPVLEEDGAWEDLASLYENQLSALEDVDDKVPIVLKAADVFHERLQDAARAFAVLSELLEASPSSEPAMNHLRRLAESTGDWQHFVDVLQQAWESCSDGEEQVRLGTIIADSYAVHLDDGAAAVDWHRRILEESPRHAGSISAMERLLNENQQFEELGQFYERLALEFDGEEKVPYLLKLGYLKEGQLEDPTGAIQAYRDLIATAPEHQAALSRLDAMLDNPILGLAAVEILEPIYRDRKDDAGLARVLVARAAEVEGSLDRADLLAEAAQLMARQPGKEAEAFDTYLQALRIKVVDIGQVLGPLAELADKLDRWPDLTSTLEEVARLSDPGEMKQELLRRLALIYMEKMSANELAQAKLKEILEGDPENAFALNMLARSLGQDGDVEEQMGVYERLGEVSVDASVKKENFCLAANLAEEGGDNLKAVEFLKRALRVDPVDAGVQDRLADIYRKQGSWKELVELLESRSSQLDDVQGARIALEAARIAHENMQAASRALALCRLVLDKEEENQEALHIMAEILAAQGKSQELMATMEKLSRFQEGDELLVTLWKLYELAVEVHDNEAAIGYVQRILEQTPEDPRAIDAKIALLRGSDNLYNLVSTYEERAKKAAGPEKKAELLYEAATTLADEIGDMAAALEKLAEIRKLMPGHVQATQKTAQVYVQQHQYQEAVETYETLTELHDSDQRKGDSLKAAARIALGEMDDAQQGHNLASRAVELLPDDAEAFELMALALEKLENREELLKLLLDRVKRTEDKGRKSTLAKRLALVYRDLGKDDLFLNWTEEAHRAQEDPELVDELLRHHRKAANVERVAPLLEWKIAYLTGRRQLKDVPTLYNELGTALADLGSKENALAAFQKCVEADGSFLPAIYRMAMLLFQLGRPEEALPSYQTLLLRINELENKEQKVNVYLNLARIHLEKGDTKRGKTYLTRLLSIDKQHKEAKELLAGL